MDGRRLPSEIFMRPMDHEELFLALHDHLPPERIYERELLTADSKPIQQFA